MSNRDVRLIYRVAMALAEHDGRELCQRHFELAKWLMTREGSVLEDSVNGIDVDVRSMIE
jgi:hypothetical protein